MYTYQNRSWQLIFSFLKACIVLKWTELEQDLPTWRIDWTSNKLDHNYEQANTPHIHMSIIDWTELNTLLNMMEYSAELVGVVYLEIEIK